MKRVASTLASILLVFVAIASTSSTAAAHRKGAGPWRTPKEAGAPPPVRGTVGDVDVSLWMDYCLIYRYGRCELYATVSNRSREAKWIVLPGMVEEHSVSNPLKGRHIEWRGVSEAPKALGCLDGGHGGHLVRIGAGVSVELRVKVVVSFDDPSCRRKLLVKVQTASELDFSDAPNFVPPQPDGVPKSGLRLDWPYLDQTASASHPSDKPYTVPPGYMDLGPPDETREIRLIDRQSADVVVPFCWWEKPAKTKKSK